jgi:hypothetical protein
MKSLGEMERDGHDADRLYAARACIADARPGHRRVGIAELVRFLSDPDFELSIEGQQALFASPMLRADFQTLRQRSRLVELPALAAASAGNLTLRTFPGGSARIHPSRVEGQVYVVIELQAAGRMPRALLLEHHSGRLAKRLLRAPDASGQLVLVLDRNKPGDALFAELLADPTTTGSFLS